MPSSARSEAARRRWASTPPEKRREHMRRARLGQRVQDLVDAWPELRPEQVAKLRALVQQPGGGTDDAA
jgi:hypothetical protein